MLLPYLGSYRRRIALGLVAMLLSTGLSRLIPWILKLAIDTLRSEGDRNRVTLLVGAMLAIAALSGLFEYIRRWFIRSTARMVEHDLRRDLFAHIQTLDVPFFERSNTGDLMAHFTNDLSAIRVVAGPGILFATSTVATLVMSVGAMLAIDPFLTLVAFAPYPIISVVTLFFSKAMLSKSRRVQDLFGSMSSRTQEDLSGIRLVRAYGQEESTVSRFNQLSTSYMDANVAVAKLRGRFMASMGALAGTGMTIAFLVGGNLVIDDTITLGSLVAFFAYLADLTWPVIAIGWVISMVQRGASAAARIQTVLEVSPSITSGGDTAVPAPRVTFDEVSFRYEGAEQDALSGISFHLEPGQTLGIVGRTGSGKSTLFKLLQRFYDPTGGHIEIDRIDLRERDLRQLRSLSGYAPQDALLFSRTIAENVAYGNPSASRAQIRAVVDKVKLLDDVSGFPDGLDTMVGERGITLSGGQRQRASLARTLLKESPLLLLDDPLSSVDSKTEQEIVSYLRSYAGDRTSIIASHRISAIQHADWILVLDRGALREQGTHSSLLEQGGQYAAIYERQRIAAEIEEAP